MVAIAPTSPHWYSPERLENLIASYVAAERAGAAPRTVRQFVAEFRGLSATAKQKTVSAAAGLERAHLHDLVIHGQLDKVAIRRLLLAMQGASKRVKPGATRHPRGSLLPGTTCKKQGLGPYRGSKLKRVG